MIKLSAMRLYIKKKCCRYCIIKNGVVSVDKCGPRYKDRTSFSDGALKHRLIHQETGGKLVRTKYQFFRIKLPDLGLKHLVYIP